MRAGSHCDLEIRQAHLLVVGASVHSTDLAHMEKLASPRAALALDLRTFSRIPSVQECLILSTCNRAEYYAVTSDPKQAADDLIGFLSHKSGLPLSVLARCLYRFTDAEAAKQLFRVTAGLDSLVLGETEITGQVKQAYEAAKSQNTIGPILHRCIQKGLHCAKILRTRTRITHGQASIGSIVAELARQLFEDKLKECEALLWGAGKAAQITLRALISGGMGKLWIVSRTQTKAQDLAASCRSGWLSWESALKHLAHVDIAIVCTQAPHYVIQAQELNELLSKRVRRPLFIVDLAVPRNVDPAVGGHPGIHLYNIDHLRSIAEATLAQRRQERINCEHLVEEQVDHFLRGRNRHAHREPLSCLIDPVFSSV